MGGKKRSNLIYLFILLTMLKHSNHHCEFGHAKRKVILLFHCTNYWKCEMMWIDTKENSTKFMLDLVVSMTTNFFLYSRNIKEIKIRRKIIESFLCLTITIEIKALDLTQTQSISFHFVLFELFLAAFPISVWKIKIGFLFSQYKRKKFN